MRLLTVSLALVVVSLAAGASTLSFSADDASEDACNVVKDGSSLIHTCDVKIKGKHLQAPQSLLGVGADVAALQNRMDAADKAFAAQANENAALRNLLSALTSRLMTQTSKHNSDLDDLDTQHDTEMNSLEQAYQDADNTLADAIDRVTKMEGPKGAKGDTGADGGAGIDGRTGIDGATGATGATGAQGEKGEKGEKGEAPTTTTTTTTKAPTPAPTPAPWYKNWKKTGRGYCAACCDDESGNGSIRACMQRAEATGAQYISCQAGGSESPDAHCGDCMLYSSCSPGGQGGYYSWGRA